MAVDTISEPPPAAAPSQVGPPPATKTQIPLQRWLAELIHLGDERQIFEGLTSLVRQMEGVKCLVYLVRDEHGRLSPKAIGSAETLPDGGASVCKAIQSHCEQACGIGSPCVARLGADLAVVANPVVIPMQPSEALAIVATAGDEQLGHVSSIGHSIAAHLSIWRNCQGEKRGQASEQDSAFGLQLVRVMGDCRTERDVCRAAASAVALYTGIADVFIGTLGRKEGNLRLVAADAMEPNDDDGPHLTNTIEAALAEVALRNDHACLPPNDDTQRHALLAQQQLLKETNSRLLLSSPVRDVEANAIGALILYARCAVTDQQRLSTLVSLAAELVGTRLRQLRHSADGPIRRAWNQFRQRLGGWLWLVALAILFLCVGVLLIPIPYRIACDCQLEPRQRRFVAAPFDGILQESMAGPGDTVVKGQLLARIDRRELRLELASLTTEKEKATKQRDALLADHDFAAAQLAKLEMERLDLKIQVLRQREKNLDIVSPIDGIVISGDVEDSQGSPLRTGQTLFEIAPLQNIRLEVSIPQDEIRFIHRGQTARVQLDAHPGATWRATIDSVQPRAEIRHNANVFIARAVLSNEQGILKPGMNGRATIISGRRSIGWILFHEPYEELLKLLGR